jgi:2,5-diketo-D-gluconate reductase B
MPTSIPVLETPRLRMPRLGLGTWPMKGAECQRAVEGALALGYRHIDTAEMYGNEEEVGAALAASGVGREEIFLTTKIWNDKPDGASIRRAFDASLRRLATPHVDLLLIHWPSPDLQLSDALRGLAAIRAEGRAKAIGVSNFPPRLLRRAIEADVGLACLQVEFHVLLDQSRLLESAARTTGADRLFAPGQGRGLDQPECSASAPKHGVTAAQVALAWLMAQPGVGHGAEGGQPGPAGGEPGGAGAALDEPTSPPSRPCRRTRFVDPAMAPDWIAAEGIFLPRGLEPGRASF